MNKKLYRSATNRKLAGVCAGIAEYFDWDPTIIRVAWALCTFFAGGGLIAYLICALIIPEKPENYIAE